MRQNSLKTSLIPEFEEEDEHPAQFEVNSTLIKAAERGITDKLNGKTPPQRPSRK